MLKRIKQINSVYDVKNVYCENKGNLHISYNSSTGHKNRKIILFAQKFLAIVYISGTLLLFLSKVLNSFKHTFFNSIEFFCLPLLNLPFLFYTK